MLQVAGILLPHLLIVVAPRRRRPRFSGMGFPPPRERHWQELALVLDDITTLLANPIDIYAAL